MSKKDSVKEDVSTYRTLAMFVLALLSAAFGFGYTNISKMSNYEIIFGFFVIIVLFVSLYFCVLKYRKAKKDLENLE